MPAKRNYRKTRRLGKDGKHPWIAIMTIIMVLLAALAVEITRTII